MRMRLKNIGLLKEAEIELDSLVLIAGENDNGKSTVGKVIFCIIKAINRYKEELQESKEYHLNEKFESLFFQIRINLLTENLLPLTRIRFLIDDKIESTKKIESLELFIAELKTYHFKDLELIEKLFTEIKAIRNKPEDEKILIENALTKAFFSEFDLDLLLNGQTDGEITLFEKELELIKIKVGKNKISLIGNVEPIQIKEATFIESPLILNQHDLLIKSHAGLIENKNLNHLGLTQTTLHTKDLFDKLKTTSFYSLFPEHSFFTENSKAELLNEIQSIIKGKISYNSEKKDFVYEKKMLESAQEQSLMSIKNTASGIKSFGILQILFMNDFLNSDTILILDEPENHLHPKWQLMYANILVLLVKYGVTVLVTSHSPYMIEALKRYSDLNKLEDKTHFYLAENCIIEPRDRLMDIFKTLEDPFETFRLMDNKSFDNE